MKQSVKIFSMMTLAILASGCSSISNHFASHVEKEPTLNGLKWSSNESKVYLRTMYVQADFKTDGSRRDFQDYDFTKESAPCTVIKKYSPRTNLYTFEHDKKTISFECRPYFSYDQPDLRRLYLIGSEKDCSDRTWDYQAPVLDSYTDVRNVCNTVKQTQYQIDVQKNYSDWLNAGVFR